ncbi:MAG: hypothetical protein ACT6RF_09170 [Allorhizobium sp.]|uniref:hypothetical protein n=1 Tax=Allorhizobium sp. TaxID=633478 RepID=UPI0040335140
MLELKWQDISGMQRLGNAMGRLDSHQRHLVLQRAVNHTGDKARTQVIRALAKQTGLGYGVIKSAVRTGRAWGAGADAQTFAPGRGSLVYVMSSTGGDISLKFFKARETLKGVTAAPFGKRKLFPRTFMKGGRFPNRKDAKRLNGHVYRPLGKSWRGPVEFQNSGVVIPEQMLQGATAEVFAKAVSEQLPPRVMHEINRLCPGIFL